MEAPEKDTAGVGAHGGGNARPANDTPEAEEGASPPATKKKAEPLYVSCGDEDAGKILKWHAARADNKRRTSGQEAALDGWVWLRLIWKARCERSLHFEYSDGQLAKHLNLARNTVKKSRARLKKMGMLSFRDKPKYDRAKSEPEYLPIRYTLLPVKDPRMNKPPLSKNDNPTLSKNDRGRSFADSAMIEQKEIPSLSGLKAAPDRAGEEQKERARKEGAGGRAAEAAAALPSAPSGGGRLGSLLGRWSPKR